jgi:glycosyltransferase involved in cell wall biosynthesis
VDLDRFRPAPQDFFQASALRHEVGLSQDDTVVGFVGRLVPQKGLPYLLAAAEMLSSRQPRLHFVIVGDGPLASELQSAAARIAAGRFLFLGERSDVHRLMRPFDLLVVPSEWEGLPIVNLEAMATGIPVVAFDIDGIPEAIVHGETGLLVPHRDRRALAAAISQLLEDPAQRQRMGADGRQRAEARFDVRFTARRLESLYDFVVGRCDGPLR